MSPAPLAPTSSCYPWSKSLCGTLRVPIRLRRPSSMPALAHQAPERRSAFVRRPDLSRGRTALKRACGGEPSRAVRHRERGRLRPRPARDGRRSPCGPQWVNRPSPSPDPARRPPTSRTRPWRCRRHEVCGVAEGAAGVARMHVPDHREVCRSGVAVQGQHGKVSDPP